VERPLPLIRPVPDQHDANKKGEPYEELAGRDVADGVHDGGIIEFMLDARSDRYFDRSLSNSLKGRFFLHFCNVYPQRAMYQRKVSTT